MKNENGQHHNHLHGKDKHHAKLDSGRLGTLVPYLKKHNLDHVEELKKWHQQAVESGFNDIAAEFGSIIELSEQIDRHFISVLEKIDKCG